MRPRIVSVGDAALAAELGGAMSIDLNRRAVTLGTRVRDLALPGIRDVVVTATTVTVHYDPWTADAAAIHRALSQHVKPESEPDAPIIVVPVEYGGDAGPDLDEVARHCGCTAADVVAWHSARTYRVIMMGFVAGFAYLWPLDERLHMPRRDAPRARVPAGSVAIAGAQTAVYPSETPGGWRIIGRTELRPFDLARQPMALFPAGARVRFQPQS